MKDAGIEEAACKVEYGDAQPGAGENVAPAAAPKTHAAALPD